MKVLSDIIIAEIKEKSGLSFEQAKDYAALAAQMGERTGRSIGTTTLKRLMGNVDDAREATSFTLNTIAQYLGYDSWADYNRRLDFESEIDYADGSVYPDKLAVGNRLKVDYLDREVTFEVVSAARGNALRVVCCKNCSLMEGDMVFIHRIRKGCPLEAERVIRGDDEWNYRTRGEVTDIQLL